MIQRVSSAGVTVDGRELGRIGAGLMVLLGVTHSDGEEQAAWAAGKIANLRIFMDETGKMNRSLLDAGGAVLLVSQFTLYGDARKGRRPSFLEAAGGEEAEAVYHATARALQELGIRCETGEFGAEMDVALVNSGPVTILLDSDRNF